MAKLLSEFISFDNLEVLKEEVIEEGGAKRTKYKLQGPFLEAETENKNGRVYPLDVLVKEVEDFSTNKIKTNRSMGELDHPENPAINLERVSHVIESLVMQDNIGMGCARLIDTPMGRIAETLVKEGIVVGMSTRGVGSLDGKNVKEDYKLITVDIVADPSAPSAFVEGVLENKEYVIEGQMIREVTEEMRVKMDKEAEQLVEEHKLNQEQIDAVAQAVGNLQEKVDKRGLSRHALQFMNEFLSEIGSDKPKGLFN